MRKVLFFAGVAMSLGVTACTNDVPAIGGNAESEVIYSASWANAYPTVEQMTEQADLVARSTITGIVSVDRDANGIYTTYSARIDSGLKYAGDLPEEIRIRQLGGELDGTSYIADDDPLLTIGEESVLFLHEFAPGNFFIVGGPTGRLPIENNLIAPLPDSALVDASGTIVELSERIESLD